MSRNYKYDFADQILIHAQRPDASACAEYDVWTERMGRYVRRGVKGIALVDYSGDVPRLRYVFDVSDTGARRNSRPFRPWTVNDGNLSEVQLGLRQDFGAEGEWLSSQLQDAARDLAEMYYNAHRHDIGGIVDGSLMAGYDESELRDSFIRAASTSTAYTLISRCGYDPSAYFEEADFAFLSEWNTPGAVTALGSAVSENTQLVLREIERTIRSYERSRYNDRNNLHDRERRTDSEPGSAQDGANREIRTHEAEISAGTPSGAVEPPRVDGDAVRAPERDRDGGTGADGVNPAEARGGSGRDGGAESRRPDALDGPDERLQGTGRRNSSERVNLQLSFFDEAEDADASSAIAFPQEVVDAVLRVGENTDYLRERVVAEFEKQRPLDEIAAFLPTVYHGGVGVVVDGEKYAAWMGTDGIRIAHGDAARNARDAQLVRWPDAAARISELLDAGQYAGRWELERAAATERELLAQQIVYLYRDLVDGQENSFFPSLDGIKSGLFPDVTERVAAMIADREQCETLLVEYRDFLAAYEADWDILRFHYHKFDEILVSFESQLLSRVQFHADTELLPSAPQFITQDEIDKMLTHGSGVEGGKRRIFQYFTEEHSVDEKAKFLRREYGIGGRSHALSGAPGSHEDHDGKGIELRKGGCEKVKLTWSAVAKRIDALIAADRYMTPAELALYDAGQRYNDFQYRYDDDILFIEHGGALYTFGPDAETVSSVLDVRIRHDSGEDFILIPATDFDDATLDKLRERRAVTIIREDGSEQTLPFVVPNEKRAEYERQLVNALMENAAYVNAVRNSDVENAFIEGDAAIKKIAAQSEDVDFQRAFDNAVFRNSLRNDVLTAAYRELKEAPVVEPESSEESVPAEDEPELNDTPVNIQPRDPMAAPYGVGDFVWYEGREYQITDIQRSYVELLAPGMAILVYRIESQKDFERGLRADERNRYITDYLTTELSDDVREYVSAVLTPEDRTQISAWLRAGEGNAQLAERLAERLSGRDGAETDSLHYRIPDDDGNIVATDFVPWEQLAGAVRGMFRNDPRAFEHGASAERTYNEVKAAHLDSLVLIHDGDVMRAYGDDAVEIAAASGLDVTNGVLSFPVSELREYTDVLRKEHDITISAPDGREQFIAADTPRIAVTDADIDASLTRLNVQAKAEIAAHIHDMTPEQLAEAYGYSPDRPMHITVTGVDGGVDLSWDEVHERVTRLVDSDRFLTASEKDELNRPRVKTVAYYEAERTRLPYDVEIRTISTSPPEPEPTPPEPTPPTPPYNFRITDEHLGEGGAKTRFRANMDAIHLLKQLESEGRAATADEQEMLLRYTGWGAIPDAFDESKPEWKREFEELKAALTPEEYEAARGSTLNAHYTSPTVIRAIYDTLANMGFEGGRILEPSCGVGNFFGLLPESMSSSQLYGVELDSITGRIAKQLYPEAEITVAGFETTNRLGFFDLAVGNVPFGNYQVFDSEYNQLGFSIHNYFAAKMLDQVRPGGIVAFVTSRYTMDAKDESVRRYLAARGELLGAIRLPNNAFLANAGTGVVSDIIFLQRRELPLTELPDWVHVGDTPEGFKVNNYFLQHPEMVLGVPTAESTRYASQDYTVAPIEGADLGEQLHEAIQHIHGEYVDREVEETQSADIIPADPDVRNYSFTLVDGDVFYREGGIMVRQDVSAAAAERIKGLMELRDCTRRLIELQTIDASDAEIAAEQRELNELYDAFTAEHGLISSRENKRAFEDDSSYYLLCSLEILDDDGKLQRKSDMFTKRTIKPHRPVEHTDTAVEALAVSMNEKARVDLPYMARLCGKDETTIASELQGVIFRIPGTDRFVTADEYLSGNVRVKLREAEAAAENDPSYSVNVDALRAAQPRDLTASEIDVRLGATWIEPRYIRQFIGETFKPSFWASQSIKVHYSHVTGEWRVEGKSAVGANDVNAYSTYGTSRMNAYKILENTLNLRDVRIYDKVEDADGNEKRVLNTKETTLAQQKQQVIKDAFRDWLWKDADRRETLVARYNELFNSVKPREYDGSHLTFPGMNPEITLRKHQRDAIARILYGGNTLLAHEVGAGKTFTMAAAAMEAKRLGLCSKPMFVVPNHLTGQWASESLRLYPSANILVTTKKDFEKANRKKFCARIATGDYDAVIIGHSQFEKIPVSQERQEQLLQDQIDELAEGIRELKYSNGERFSIKAMERSRKALTAKLRKLLDSPRDDVVTFEELGVDRLFVDESHAFKNLYYQTKMQNVAGLSSAEAQKSSDMFAKCRYLDEKTGSRGVVFATGTPVSNTMVELYTIQRYLQHDTLGRLGMNLFDSWAANFGETVTAMELAPEGTGYRARTRFSKFFNLPELMSLFHEAADIKTADELNLPRPEVVYHNEVSQPTEIQKALVKELSERASKVHARLVEPDVDNMLAITNDGRKLGLDQRVVNPLLPDEPGTKVNKCVDNVFRIWEEGADEKLTQLIFCDLSTPGKGFNVYDDIKKKLVARGVPESEIAFIHDANTDEKKKALFAKVRSGQVRVLMGSTAKMGAGTNVQDRLIALHDLDAPWRPGDLEQRKGRIARQGNMNETVHIYRYVTENTFDSYIWQTLENKQKFISQIMTSKSPVRSCEDVDETTLSFAEIKALCAGDPRIKEQMNLVVEVSKLRMLKSSFQSQQYTFEDRLLHYYPNKRAELNAQIAKYEADIKICLKNPSPEKGFAGMEINGIRYSKHKAAGAALLDAVSQITSLEPVRIGSYRGFELQANCSMLFGHSVYLKGKAAHRLSLSDDPVTCAIQAERALSSLSGELSEVRERLEALEKNEADTRAELGKPFPQEAELAEKSARLIELNAELDMENKTRPEPVSEEKEEERPSLLAKLKEPIPLYEPKPQQHFKEACR